MSEGVMDDESGESMEPIEEVPLRGLGESELERLAHYCECPLNVFTVWTISSLRLSTFLSTDKMLLSSMQGVPKLYKVQITTTTQPFQITSDRFHQNVPRVSDNKNSENKSYTKSVAVNM